MTTALRRYTNVPALIYLLREKKITLLDPASWDDKNDSYFLSIYKQKKGLKSVLALCFTQGSETYHHWRVFADGSSGACVRFKHDELVKAVAKKGVRAKTVKYLTISNIRGKSLKLDTLPFLKRAPYEDEREFRLLFESSTETIKTLDVDIPLSCIDRVTLSPWIPSALAGHIKKMIRDASGRKNLEVVRSTLIGNEEWKKAGDGAA